MMNRALILLCTLAAGSLVSCNGGGAPAGLAGKTLHLEVPVTMNEGLSAPQAGSIPLNYRFRKGSVSEKSKGGLTLTYTRRDNRTAVATLSGSVPVEYELHFRGASQGTLTVKRTAKDGKVSTQDGKFSISR